MTRRPRPKVERIREAGDGVHGVITYTTNMNTYCRKPCAPCPWKVENTGNFPAEAFRLSAEVAHDASMHTFACHDLGLAAPSLCAGFLLRGADHNIGIRIAARRGSIDLDQVHDGGAELHASYRAMAEANGVDPDDPALRDVRDPGYS